MSTSKLSSFALIGNPNSGKTTLFNALTGLRQKVGNYPGVTVEKKTGEALDWHGNPLLIVDLPGTYSLTARSPDEAITRSVLLAQRADTPRPDGVVCVLDASNLERNLYLASQVLDLGLPTVLALNMMDLAESRGRAVDPGVLEEALGVRVVPCQANRKQGIQDLRLALTQKDWAKPKRHWTPPESIEAAAQRVAEVLIREDSTGAVADGVGEAILLLTEEVTEIQNPAIRAAVESERVALKGQGIDPHEVTVAARYQALQALCEQALEAAQDHGPTVSDRLDGFLTHRVWGWLVFFTLMATLFFCIFTIAQYPMDWIDAGVKALAGGVKNLMPDGDLRDLITDGVISGVGSVVVFLPQILTLFFFIGLLEDTGYMSRAAFIMDRVMSRVGLHGKSFIPLLSSYACAIPGIMATRTIENPKDRLVTILVAPLMSCSARLPVYALMIAVLIPGGSISVLAKVGMLIGLYALGTGTAFFMAWLFKRTLMKGETPFLIMELPPYRRPVVRTVLINMFNRAKDFLKNAGTVILGISIILWALAAYPKAKSPDVTPAEQLRQSYAGRVGHFIEPAIKPLGYDWKVGIGLVASFAAREVFVSTMSIVYSVEEGDDNTSTLREAMQKDTWPDGRPVYTPLVGVSVLVFYVLAMQCMSTLAVVRRETNSWRWPAFQFAYMTGLAYVVALLVYQGGRALGF